MVKSRRLGKAVFCKRYQAPKGDGMEKGMKALNYDVCVLGAGPAGVAAAIAARRNNASVLLVERDGVVGGMSTAGMLNIWCGDAYGSIFEYICSKTTKLFPSGRRIYSPETLKILLIEMLEQAGVELLLHSFADEVCVQNGRVEKVGLSGKSGKITVNAKVFIDCTGDGDVCALAGVPFEMGREDGKLQPMTVQFCVGGVDESKALFADVGTPYLKGKMQEYLADGRVSFPVGLLILIESLEPHTAHVNMTNVIDVDPTNVFDLTKAELTARKQIPQIVRFLRENVPGYENCYVAGSSAYAGARESRRICGEYVMSAADIQSGTMFEDWIVDGAAYEFGIHNPKGRLDEEDKKPKDNKMRYTIPYGCFTPKGIKNLMVAGRCISGDHYALSSYRVMPICFAMGEGVGTCTALALAENTAPTELSAEQISRVQRLIKQGIGF